MHVPSCVALDDTAMRLLSMAAWAASGGKRKMGVKGGVGRGGEDGMVDERGARGVDGSDIERRASRGGSGDGAGGGGARAMGQRGGVSKEAWEHGGWRSREVDEKHAAALARRRGPLLLPWPPPDGPFPPNR